MVIAQADSCEEATEMAQRTNPDVAIVDVAMPEEEA